MRFSARLALVIASASTAGAAQAEEHVLALSRERLAVIAEGGDRWCGSHLRLRMDVDPESAWYNRRSDPVPTMNKLGRPIAVDCPAAVSAEMVVRKAGSSRPYFASAEAGWRFSSSPDAASRSYAGGPGSRPPIGRLPAGYPTGRPGSPSQAGERQPLATIVPDQQPGADGVCASAKVKQGMMTVMQANYNDPMLKVAQLFTAFAMDTAVSSRLGSIVASKSVGTDAQTGDIVCSATFTNTNSVRSMGLAAASAEGSRAEAAEARAAGRYRRADAYDAAAGHADSDAMFSGLMEQVGQLPGVKDQVATERFAVRRTETGYHVRDLPMIVGTRINATDVSD